MRYLRYLFTLVTVIAIVAASAMAGGVKVIANSSVAAASVSPDDLKDIFLLTKTSLDGNHVEPVVQQAGDTHEAFANQYLHKTGQALATYYRAQLMAGNAVMPKALASDAEVVAYVAKTKGAIGYVSGEAAAAGVKTLGVN